MSESFNLVLFDAPSRFSYSVLPPCKGVLLPSKSSNSWSAEINRWCCEHSFVLMPTVGADHFSPFFAKEKLLICCLSFDFWLCPVKKHTAVSCRGHAQHRTVLGPLFWFFFFLLFWSHPAGFLVDLGWRLPCKKADFATSASICSQVWDQYVIRKPSDDPVIGSLVESVRFLLKIFMRSERIPTPFQQRIKPTASQIHHRI